jgi:hypothetical protein
VRVRGEALTVRPDAWVDELTSQIKQEVRARAVKWEILGLTAPPINEMLDRFTALLPPAAPNALDEEIGPFYDTAGVEMLLGGVSKQAVEARRKKHTILAVRTSDHRWAYPTFQFTGSEVDPALVPAIQALKGAPAWAAALWFVTPNPDLDEVTPLEWARSGRPTEAVLGSARRTVSEWQ